MGIINSTMHTENDMVGTRRRKLFRLIIMGGGYDTRGLKLLEQSFLTMRMMDNDDNDIDYSDPSRNIHRLRLQSQGLNTRRQRHRWRWWKNISTRRRWRNDDQLNGNDRVAPSLTAETKADASFDLECYELDLPEVVEAKRRLLQTRLFRRRPWLRDAVATEGGDSYPKLVATNFNNSEETRRALESILLPPPSLPRRTDSYEIDDVTNIIIFEGVMIYLDDGIPHSLLRLCSELLETATPSSNGYLCFADRLENIPGGDFDAACFEMENTGWQLIDWLPKPGLARHMGIARLLRQCASLR
jgi:hypothetical protein